MPLIAMEDHLSDSKLATKKELTFTIEKYVNSKKLMMNIAQTLLSEEKESESSSSFEEEDSGARNKALIAACIDALKLDHCTVTIGSSKITLKKLLDTRKFKRLLIAITENCFEAAYTTTELCDKFFNCINWKKLQQTLTNKEYLELHSTSSALVGIQAKKTIDMSSCLNTLTRLFLGFDLTDYLNIPLLTTLMQTESCTKELTSMGHLAACINLTPFLRSTGCLEEERIQQLQKAFIGYFTLIHDLVISRNRNAAEYILSFLEQQGQNTLNSLPQIQYGSNETSSNGGKTIGS